MINPVYLSEPEGSRPFYLGRREAARFLSESGFPTSHRTLEKLACAGGGPTYRVWCRRTLYTREDLLAWAEARLSSPRRHTSGGER